MVSIHSIDTVCIVLLELGAVHSTGVKEAIKYAGLVYYEEKGVEDLVTFTAAKELDALLEVICICTCNSLLAHSLHCLYSLLTKSTHKLN